MQHIKWHIGCSGFYYREWKGLFYPEKLAQKKWFEFYAQHFNTIEINNTFYRFPEQKLFDNWYAKALPDFCFSVKVPQLITHYQRLLNYIVPDVVHVLFDGRIVRSGPRELALELEEKGYDWIVKHEAVPA